ncbi:cobalamin biosynthesis protein [uncultured Tateyamaria sp.]|uniref:cobalamin biosynthesis protein n=1 Tax=uncultured Tateyamaria sp. TaxID=455651 RepID=UPI00262420E9|nr:cobalamin biosynthesis protein [uncultured Tateyamaria sp.]
MIVAGFGFTSRATADSLAAALAATGYKDEVTLMAAPWDKAMQPALLDLSKEMRVMIMAITSSKLEAAQTATQSPLSRLLRRTGSVAEAAALAAAGPGATLLCTRHISKDRMATCAIAKGADT